ncbi:MAG: ABC transporter ATP-binding protein, partial [Verrucomicrobiota bacterium]
MSDTVIRVENISKLYRLGEVGTGTLSHDLNRWWHKVRGREDPYLKIGQTNDRTVKSDSDYAWALKDINFEVKRGEVLGIIGRNGAGKSTLLKILSRVTTPTSGEIKIKGRVASLLEVGTGFNPELTGRDNIYLNGAILGMRRQEINRKFDEIVGFSGVERYIDTPVKRYSSGMYVRLAFAVAAHLEPEILIVDEVLAVGDAEFQKKCLGKMQDVAGHGRTILFVSHNMPSVARLCKQGILLHRGQKVSSGNIRDIISDYNEMSFNAKSEVIWPNDASAPGNSTAVLRAVRLRAEDNTLVDGAIDISEDFSVEVEYELLKLDGDQSPIPAIHVVNENGVVLFSSADFDRSRDGKAAKRTGVVVSQCHIPGGLLAEGRFSILAAVVSYNPNIVHAIVPEALSFQAIETATDGVRGECVQDWPGVVRPQLRWS